jgi:hypothetical protein
VAAAEAEAIGCGGISPVSQVTGASRRAIRVGKQALLDFKSAGQGVVEMPDAKIRKPGEGSVYDVLWSEQQ